MGDTIQCTACGGQGYLIVDKMEQDKDGNVTSKPTHERCGRCGGSGSIDGH